MHALAPVPTHDAQGAVARVRGVVGDDLLRAPLVERLDRISFLGALDAQPDATRQSTRFEHAIAVAALACDVADNLDLDVRETALLVAASMLHDVGHYPLSHSTERAFARIAGVDHHQQTQSIVLGLAHESGSVVRALTALEIAPSEVSGVIRGTGERDDGLNRLITAPINLDTLDGICRTAATFGIPVPSISTLFHRFQARIWLRPSAIETCDEFWKLKNRVYQTIIERASNVVTEAHLCQRIERITTRLPDLVALDDRWLADVLGEVLPPSPALAEIDRTHEVVEHEPTEPVALRTLKRYWVDETVEPATNGLPIEMWGKRYRHDRHAGYVVRTSGRNS